jgi:hypothetical protein
MNKENICIPYNVILTTTKKESLLFTTTWMDLEDILSEISQTQKDKHCTAQLSKESKLIKLIEQSDCCQGLWGRRNANTMIICQRKVRYQNKFSIMQEKYIPEIYFVEWYL